MKMPNWCSLFVPPPAFRPFEVKDFGKLAHMFTSLLYKVLGMHPPDLNDPEISKEAREHADKVKAYFEVNAIT